MGDTHFSGRVIEASDSPAVVAGDFALSAGWGTTASVSAVAAGSKDARGRITIASAGTGQVADPTVTLTLKEGFADKDGGALTPFGVASRGDVAAAAGDFRITSRTATQVVFTFKGTPVAGQSYILDYRLFG